MKYQRILVGASLAVSTLGFGGTAFAEDIAQIFKKVNDYVATENYTKALDELSWARKEIEKLNATKITKLLPDQVNGFKGETPKVQTALGINNIERRYSNGSTTIEVSLTGGGDALGGAGGLAGLARMGMMMGAQEPGSETFRIEGKTATLSTSSGRPELTVILESGQILKVEGASGSDAAAVKSFAEGLKISALDTYLGGK